MESRPEWSNRLKRIASGAGVLDHPFLTSVATFSRERKQMIHKWARQDYFTSRDFPCILGILSAQISDPYIRHPLVVNLWEEHGEGDVSQSHFSLYCNLLKSIGVDTPVDEAIASKATMTFLECQEAIARQNLLAGLGAFCYANEYLAEKEFDSLEHAVTAEFGGADCSFFAANREADGRHTDQTEDVIDALVRTDSDLDDVLEGATVGLKARIAFYDSLIA